MSCRLRIALVVRPRYRRRAEMGLQAFPDGTSSIASLCLSLLVVLNGQFGLYFLCYFILGWSFVVR